LGDAFGLPVVETSALKRTGSRQAAEEAIELAKNQVPGDMPSVFEGGVEHAIAHIEESIESKVDRRYLRWYAIKLFERDEKVIDELGLGHALSNHIEEHIAACGKGNLTTTRKA
jgi:ferrous iron transport protein B